MPISRIIQILEMLKAELEWDYSLNYQIALERAIEILTEIKDTEEDEK